MMMRNQAEHSETVGDLELAIAGNVELAGTDYLTFFTAVSFFSKFSDILLLTAAAICGLMETVGSRWTDCYPQLVFEKEAEMLQRSTLGFLIPALIALAEIKSQGQTGFPFQTHPQAIMISINSLLIYGLASGAEHVFSAYPPSVYVILARLGRIGSLCILVGSLALLFYI